MTSKAQSPAAESEQTPAVKQGRASRVRDRTGPREVVLTDTLTVKELADLMGVNPIEVIKQLMRSGVMAGINQVIGFDIAELITPAFGYKAKRQEEQLQQLHSTSQEEDASSLVIRPPVVTIMGHVDHGKTTLLDAIRNTRVADSEVGGITQHIGAYQVEYKNQKITFLDTPGHEAFTAIRARGARVTDIAVLVVAADDGVMPQTVEAINHARAADVVILVAINKIDKPEADPERAKRELADQGLVLEEWGGDVIVVPVSAKEGIGLDELLENILVVSEVAELKANPNRPASGVVIEARLDKTKGPLATVLVQNGTLRVGDYVAAGSSWGRIKAMTSHLGRRVKEAGPSMPVEMMGFGTLPTAGDPLAVWPTEKATRATAEARETEGEREMAAARALTLEEIHTKISAGEVKELSLVVKADVQGSVEAVRTSLEHLDAGEAKARLLHVDSGTITESDILLASASSAIVLGFNTTLEPGAERLAEREGVEIRHYNIIYHLIEDIEKALKGILEPTQREVVQGRAEVREVFQTGKQMKIAGCMVAEGSIARGATVRVLRDGKVIHEGSVASLRRFKEDVNQVSSGYECGVTVQGFTDYQTGDVLEAYRRERVRS